jgi:hypothetical protein
MSLIAPSVTRQRLQVAYQQYSVSMRAPYNFCREEWQPYITGNKNIRRTSYLRLFLM